MVASLEHCPSIFDDGLFKLCLEYTSRSFGAFYLDGDQPLKVFLRVLHIDWFYITIEDDRLKDAYDSQTLFVCDLYLVCFGVRKVEDDLAQIVRSGLQKARCCIRGPFESLPQVHVIGDYAGPNMAIRLRHLHKHQLSHRTSSSSSGWISLGWCLFQTSRGYLGMAPLKTQAGDIVCGGGFTTTKPQFS
jgi:hypothetical protein